MEPIKIDVESKDKCYFCGRKKEEIQQAINKMKIGIREAKSSLEKEGEDLDAEFKKKEILELQTIEESFNQLNLQPLVSMTSKPLGKITAAWKKYEAIGGKGGPIQVPAGKINEPNKFDMKDRIDNVGFVLTVCHFCYDRFQGSTL